MSNAWVRHLKDFYAKNKGKMSYKQAMKEAKKTYKKVKVIDDKKPSKSKKSSGLDTQESRLKEKSDRRKVVSRYNKLKKIVESGLKSGHLTKKEFDGFAELSNILKGESKTNKYAKTLNKYRKEYASKKYEKIASKAPSLSQAQIDRKVAQLEKIMKQDKEGGVKGVRAKRLEILRQSGLSAFGRTDADISRIIRRRDVLRRLGKSENEIKKIIDEEEKQRQRSVGSVLDPRLNQYVMASGFLNKKGRNKIDAILRKIGRNNNELDITKLTVMNRAFKSKASAENTLGDLEEFIKLPITEEQKKRFEAVAESLKKRLTRFRTTTPPAPAPAPPPVPVPPVPTPPIGPPAPPPPPPPPPPVVGNNPSKSLNDQIQSMSNVSGAKSRANDLGVGSFIYTLKGGTKETKVYILGSRGKFVLDRSVGSNGTIDPSTFDFSAWYEAPNPNIGGGGGGGAPPPPPPPPPPTPPTSVAPTAAQQATIDGKGTVANAKAQAKTFGLTSFLYTTGGKRKEYQLNSATGKYKAIRVVSIVPPGGGGGGGTPPPSPAPPLGSVPPTSSTTFHNPQDQAEFEAQERNMLANALKTGVWLPITYKGNVYKYDSGEGQYVVEQLNNPTVANPSNMDLQAPDGSVPEYTKDGTAEQTDFINLKELLDTKTTQLFEDIINDTADDNTNLSADLKTHLGSKRVKELESKPFEDQVLDLLQDPAYEDYVRKKTQDTLYSPAEGNGANLNRYKTITGSNYDITDVASTSSLFGAGFGDLVKKKLLEKHGKNYKKPTIQAPKALADNLHELMVKLDKNFGKKSLEGRLKNLHIDARQTFHKEYLKLIKEIRLTVGKLKLTALRSRQSTAQFDELLKDLDHFHRHTLGLIEERIGGKRASENNILLNELNSLHGGNLFNAIGCIKSRGARDNNKHSNYVNQGIHTLLKKGQQFLANKMNADPYNNISHQEHGQIVNHIGKYLYNKIYKYQKPNVKPPTQPMGKYDTQFSAGLAGGAIDNPAGGGGGGGANQVNINPDVPNNQAVEYNEFLGRINNAPNLNQVGQNELLDAILDSDLDHPLIRALKERLYIQVPAMRPNVGGAFNLSNVRRFVPSYNLNNPMYSNAPQTSVPNVGGNRKVHRKLTERANAGRSVGLNEFKHNLLGGSLPSGKFVEDTKTRPSNSFFNVVEY